MPSILWSDGFKEIIAAILNKNAREVYECRPRKVISYLRYVLLAYVDWVDFKVFNFLNKIVNDFEIL